MKDTPAMQQPIDNPSTTSAPGPHLRLVTSEPDRRRDGELQFQELGRLELELGGCLPSITLAYRTWGQLNETRDNAVLVVHALTGDSNAGNHDGWWAPLIGSGKAIDTDNAFVICSNVIGGCQGSTGPASIDPTTGRPYAMRFPLITIGDMVNAQRRLIEHLGIRRVVVAGGSIGGFQVLDWSTRHSDLVAGSATIAASGALGPQGIALNEAGRRAIMADPDWHGGDYARYGTVPSNGLAIARMIAMVTYHSQESMRQRFGRQPATRPGIYPSFGTTFDVEGYIHYHGAALVRRFDANSYLFLTRAMDMYDLARDGNEATWLRQVDHPMLFAGIRTDWLFPPDEIRNLAERAAEYGVESSYFEIDSPDGHDAFLKEWEQMTDIVRPFMERTLSAG
jgi:homoserine O-acetyltransferase